MSCALHHLHDGSLFLKCLVLLLKGKHLVLKRIINLLRPLGNTHKYLLCVLITLFFSVQFRSLHEFSSQVLVQLTFLTLKFSLSNHSLCLSIVNLLITGFNFLKSVSRVTISVKLNYLSTMLNWFCQYFMS